MGGGGGGGGGGGLLNLARLQCETDALFCWTVQFVRHHCACKSTAQHN